MVQLLSNEQAGILFKNMLFHANNKGFECSDVAINIVLQEHFKHNEKQAEISVKRSVANGLRVHKNTHKKSTKVNKSQQNEVLLKKDTQKYSQTKKPPISQREQDFINQTNQFVQYDKSMLDNFINYWCEKNAAGDKMKFEMQKTFEISKRLITWYNRGTQNTFAQKQKSAFRESDFN